MDLPLDGPHSKVLFVSLSSTLFTAYRHLQSLRIDASDSYLLLLDYTTEPGSVKASSRRDARGIRGNYHPSARPIMDMDLSLHHTCEPEKCPHCSDLPKSINPPGDRLYGLHYVCYRALGNTSGYYTAHYPAF